MFTALLTPHPKPFFDASPVIIYKYYNMRKYGADSLEKCSIFKQQSTAPEAVS
jgi:hypothetical protein